ncbi:MAG: response regulator transcription factor, partial [Acidimicrobiia bacterium]
MARILVAEDEKSLAELIEINLKDEGHEVVIAEDGRFALQALMDGGPFDLIVLDLMMPWSDGFDVLQNLGPAKPKVVVLTAREDAYTKERAEKARVDFFITKPYEPQELLKAISDLLSS